MTTDNCTLRETNYRRRQTVSSGKDRRSARAAPLEALSVREVKGYGRQKDHLQEYGQSDYALAFLPKVEIEAWVEDSRAAEVVERISQIAHTGRMGDGKVFILPCQNSSSQTRSIGS